MNQNQNKRGRKPLPAGQHRIASSITMSPEAWGFLDHLCKEYGKSSRSRMIEYLLFLNKRP
jgi:hypothetical protein